MEFDIHANSANESTKGGSHQAWRGFFVPSLITGLTTPAGNGSEITRLGNSSPSSTICSGYDTSVLPRLDDPLPEANSHRFPRPRLTTARSFQQWDPSRRELVPNRRETRPRRLRRLCKRWCWQTPLRRDSSPSRSTGLGYVFVGCGCHDADK